MQEKYDHKEIEGKWQKVWEKEQMYKAEDFSPKPKFYALFEFNYPSGDGLHVGHVRTDTAMDIISRKRRMNGYNVLYPVGWDSFGLPTENYAIKTGISPQLATKKNTDNFRRQMKSLGISVDWSREIDTSDPKYYKWTQWIFLQLFKRGLAYKARMEINWCPKDKIGLANEEVIDGKCERCGTEVEKREKEQWMLAITKYADRLDKDLDTVDYLPQIKIQQRNWIGRSEGAIIKFNIAPQPPLNLRGGAEQSEAGVIGLEVFTTRADTLFGATYLVVAPENQWLQQEIANPKSQITNKSEIEKYLEEVKKKTEIDRTDAKKEKTGVKLEEVWAVNPASGEKIPIFVADYVLANYGTGAVMAVPAHDERDFAFAQKYGLPIKVVVIPRMPDPTNPHREGKEVVFRDTIIAVVKNPKTGKYLCLKWKKHPWVTFVMGGMEEGETPEQAAEREIKEETGYKNFKFIKSLGSAQSEFFANHKDVNRIAHTRELLFELIDEEKENISAEESEIHELEWRDLEGIKGADMTHSEMPIILAGLEGERGAFTEEGIVFDSGEFTRMESKEAREKIAEKFGKKITKYKLRDWVFSRQRYWGEPIPLVNCEKCGWVAIQEKDLPVKLPEVENYKPTDTGESPLSNITEWVNIKCPQCGGDAKRETDVMPNWAGSSWYYLRYIDPHNDKEFADQKKLKYWTPVDWYNGGMEHTTLHLLYSRFWHKFLFDIGVVPTNEPYAKRTSHGLILAKGGEKMSKSKGNVVNPDDVAAIWGADSLRLYEMFMGPFSDAIAWDTDNMIGVRRFLERVWKLSLKVESRKAQDEKLSNLETFKLETLLHKTIKKVTEDIESFKFNTAISAMMIFINELDTNTRMGSNDTNVIPKESLETFLKILAPFAPHMTEEIWHCLGHQESIHLAEWPKYDPTKITDEKVVIVVQINGKIRAQFEAEAGMEENMAKNKALVMPEVKKWLAGKEIKRVIFVPQKLINFVL